MKNILVIDAITDDRSISQLDHLVEILELEKTGRSVARHPKGLYRFRSIHGPSEMLSEEELSKADGVIFSGSTKSAYEDFPWKKKMFRAFETVIEKNIPTLAICFGAQLLAIHLGAKVGKNPQGVEFGPIKVELTKEGKRHLLLKGYDRDRFLFASHQDCIEQTPPGAVLLARNGNSTVQAFQFGPMLATQFHMDIPTGIARKLLESRKQKYLDNGFLKTEQSYQNLLTSLPKGEQSYPILRKFVENPELACLSCKPQSLRTTNRGITAIDGFGL